MKIHGKYPQAVADKRRSAVDELYEHTDKGIVWALYRHVRPEHLEQTNLLTAIHDALRDGYAPKG